jgi:hypothetical protein
MSCFSSIGVPNCPLAVCRLQGELIGGFEKIDRCARPISGIADHCLSLFLQLSSTVMVIFGALRKIVQFLNAYANLLLVFITGVYVWLTWRSLEFLRESTLRDREAVHLQEIKESVIEPLTSWIGGTVLDRFKGGRSPQLLASASGYEGKQREIIHTLDDPFVPMRRLNVPGDPDVLDPLATWTSTKSGRISEFLYDHTKRAHFGNELREFDRLFEEVRQLTGTIVSFANQCAKGIGESEIPQACHSGDENTMSEWMNPHLLVAVSIESLLLGEAHPKTHLESSAETHLLLNNRNEAIARAMQPDKLNHWSELAFENVRRRWEENHLTKKVQHLLRRAAATRQTVGQLMFTQSLGVNCDLVSGRSRRWRK